jgi:hypothetical protein
MAQSARFSHNINKDGIMSKYLKLWPAVLSIALIVLPVQAEAETHERGRWYIGFGVGGGLDARYELNRKDITFDKWLEGTDKGFKAAINFKVGGTLNPKTLLGFDVTAVGQSGKDARGNKGHIQINNYFLMLTHFPYEEGFFIRVGGGLSNIMYQIDASLSNSSDIVSGYGILGGLGYAFWLGKSFNLTVNLDHSRQFYPSSTTRPENSQFTILYLGFDWY